MADLLYGATDRIKSWDSDVEVWSCVVGLRIKLPVKGKCLFKLGNRLSLENSAVTLKFVLNAFDEVLRFNFLWQQRPTLYLNVEWAAVSEPRATVRQLRKDSHDDPARCRERLLKSDLCRVGAALSASGVAGSPPAGHPAVHNDLDRKSVG